jgi:hypothetical protein
LSIPATNQKRLSPAADRMKAISNKKNTLIARDEAH